MSIRQLAGWILLAFLLWWVIEQPSSAAHAVHNLAAFLTLTASRLSRFFSDL